MTNPWTYVASTSIWNTLLAAKNDRVDSIEELPARWHPQIYLLLAGADLEVQDLTTFDLPGVGQCIVYPISRSIDFVIDESYGTEVRDE